MVPDLVFCLRISFVDLRHTKTNHMSTRSQIGLMQEDGTVLSIYAHYDGHPGVTGELLKTFYNTPEKVRDLIALGNLSYVAKEIGERQDFMNFVDRNWDWCLAYGRDRGDKNQEAKLMSSKQDFVDVSKLGWAEYIYLYENGRWIFMDIAQRRYSGWTELSGPIRTHILS